MRLAKTTAFRWALVYMLLFSVGVSAVLGFVYWNTSALITGRLDADITREHTALLKIYRQAGPERFLERLNERILNTGEGLYLLTDFTGRPIAGNLQQLPEHAKPGGGVIELAYEAKTRNGFELHSARARLSVLAGGFRFLVGRDIQELRRFQAMMLRVFVTAILLSLILGLGSGIFMSRNMLKRIDKINATTKAIMQGDLDQRVPFTGTNDEIDTLAKNINAMLDKITLLMGGLREVSENIAHDLKTPLTRLTARLEDTSRAKGIDATTKTALAKSVKEAHELIETFNALLRIARAEAGAGHFEKLDAGALIGDVVELYEPVAQEKNVQISTDLPAEITALLDRQLISQAVANLIDNALKYGSAGEDKASEIEIKLERNEKNIHISICDNGAGITPAEYEHVTQRFVRLERARSAPGSGLGLSLASAAAHLHKGKLELADNKPGLCVNLILPQ